MIADTAIIELELPVNAAGGYDTIAAGEAYLPSEPTWEFKTEGFYASYISGCQRLPNGAI